MNGIVKSLPAPLRRLGRTVVNVCNHLRERGEWQRRLHSATPVLLYQMGKVGSQTMYRSLRPVYPGLVLRTHAFDHPGEPWQIRQLHALFGRKRLPHGRLKILSPIREPVGRNVSSFFQNFERETGIPCSRASTDPSRLRDLFLRCSRHEVPLDWFDRHIRRLFGIDVFAKPFPECGYEVYRNGKIEVLVSKAELNEESKTCALSELLELPDGALRLEPRNVGASKDYAPIYESFHRDVKLPDSYIARMCDSKYFRHFYDDEMRRRIEQRWLG